MLKSSCFIFLFFLVKVSYAQSVEILGKVVSKTDVENIHVINKTAKTFTITNKSGEFKITAKINDTLQFSSIQQGIKDIVVSKGVITSKTMLVPLDEQVNRLDEVVVGKVLTGDLLSDIENAETDDPINFYDVGIPGYTGKIATQSERRLFEATTGAGIIPLNPIINAISGRTKMLKERIKIEKRANLFRRIKSDLADDFFNDHFLENDLKADFFFFCEEDPNLVNRCQGKSDLEIFQYLKERLEQYKQNRQSTDE